MNISVVIPAYNTASGIAGLIRALKEQSLPAAEIVVADDGSGDDTALVAGQEGAQVLRLPHGGPAKARNAGAKAASGDIIVFIDSDCMPTSDFLEKLTAPLRNNSAQVAKGAYRTNQSNWAARFVQLEFEERYAKLSREAEIDFVDSYAMAILRIDFEQAGGFDGTFPRADNEDVDLSYRLGKLGKRMVFIADAIVFHKHPANWGRYFVTKLGRGYWRFKVYARYPTKALQDSYTPQSLKLQMLSVLLLLPGWFLALIFVNLWFGFAPLILFLAFCLPFLSRAAQNSIWLLLLSPWGLFIRALALTLGSIGGFWRFVIQKK